MKIDIVFIEDRERARELLKETFKFFIENPNFNIVILNLDDFKEEKDLVEKIKEYKNLFLVVADMHLEGFKENGARISLKIQKAFSPNIPEFIMISAFDKPEYYHDIFNLGTPNFFKRGDADATPQKLIHHVQALILRKALLGKSSEMAKLIEKIVKTSHSPISAISKFCSQVVCEKLDSFLIGNNYCLLLDKPSGTYLYRGEKVQDLNEGIGKAYSLIQKMVYNDTTKPFVVQKKEMYFTVLKEIEYKKLQTLDGAVFIPLTLGHSIKLSIGILRSKPTQLAKSQEYLLAEALIRHFRSAALEQAIEVTSRWSRVFSNRKAVLSAISKFCLCVGVEQMSLLDCASEIEDISQQSFYIKKVKEIAKDLRNAGNLLNSYESKLPSDSGLESFDLGDPLSIEEVTSLTESIWREVANLYSIEYNVLQIEKGELFGTISKTTFPANRGNIAIIISHILEWLSLRLKLDNETKPCIVMKCEKNEEYQEVRISFEDNSPRLDEELCNYILNSFKIDNPLLNKQVEVGGKTIDIVGQHFPLFFVKTLVEIQNGLVMINTANENEQSGNCIKLCFESNEYVEFSEKIYAV